jgi:hypothetical protein
VLIAVPELAENSTAQASPIVGDVTANLIVAIFLYFLLLCIKEIPMIGTTIIPNPQRPIQNGLEARVSTI